MEDSLKDSATKWQFSHTVYKTFEKIDSELSTIRQAQILEYDHTKHNMEDVTKESRQGTIAFSLTGTRTFTADANKQTKYPGSIKLFLYQHFTSK